MMTVKDHKSTVKFIILYSVKIAITCNLYGSKTECKVNIQPKY